MSSGRRSRPPSITVRLTVFTATAQSIWHIRQCLLEQLTNGPVYPSRQARFGDTRGRLTKEQTMNYVLLSFREDIMFRAVVEEAAALTSLALFVGMIAVWVQVFAAL